jgi:hypothetical protein
VGFGRPSGKARAFRAAESLIYDERPLAKPDRRRQFRLAPKIDSINDSLRPGSSAEIGEARSAKPVGRIYPCADPIPLPRRILKPSLRIDYHLNLPNTAARPSRDAGK